MIQVLPPAPPKRTIMGSFLSGIAQGIPGTVDKFKQSAKEKELMEKKSKAAKLAGLPEGFEYLDPSVQAQYLRSHEGEKPEKPGDKSLRLLRDQQLKYLQKKEKLYDNLINGDQDLEEPQPIQQKSIQAIPEEEPQGKNGRKYPALYPQKKIEQMSLVNPAVARSWEVHNEQIKKDMRHDEDIQVGKEKEKTRKTELQEKVEREERSEFHKESKSYDESLAKIAEAAEKQNRSLDYQMKLQPKIGKWDRFASAAFTGTKWENLVKSGNAQSFDAAVLAQLEGKREILGGILSDRDIRTILQKVVTSEKNPEANRQIADYIKFENSLPIEKYKIAEELKKENKGYRPSGFRAEVEKRYNEKFGPEIKRRTDRILGLKDDPKLKKQYSGVGKVSPGTLMTPDIAQEYADRYAGETQQKIQEKAKNDGYVWYEE